MINFLLLLVINMNKIMIKFLLSKNKLKKKKKK